MTPKEFFDKVVEMRRCQKEYLKNKRQIDLRISKQIEREVDEEIERASALIDKYGYKGEYFLYCILMDFEESFARVNYWKSKSRRFLPHCQPFRDLNNPHQIIPQWQKDMAHWADRKEIYMSCDFKDFSPRKGFLCKEYFKIL